VSVIARADVPCAERPFQNRCASRARGRAMLDRSELARIPLSRTNRRGAVKLATSLPVSTPARCRDCIHGTYGGQGKAAGTRLGRRLCCLSFLIGAKFIAEIGGRHRLPFEIKCGATPPHGRPRRYPARGTRPADDAPKPYAEIPPEQRTENRCRSMALFAPVAYAENICLSHDLPA
jgi:hypothetical protein